MQSVCRTCLASDVRLLPLKSVPQTDIFEKLTKLQFNVDGRPKVICNDCFWNLQRCRDFCEMANRSEGIFKELIAKGIETTPQNITKLNQQMHQPSSASVPGTTIDTHTQPWSTSEIVTIEFVKVEPVSETEEKSVKENEDGISAKENELSDNEDGISVKENREKLFACDECNMNFVDRYRLVAHMRVHDEENPYTCTICDKAFTQNSSLERHMRIHTGEKPYGCLECLEHFSQKSSLIAHKRIHSGEKPYPCKSCGKRFGKKGTLVRHMTVHTGEKPYPCKSCGKRFGKKCTLVRHMTVHTGEKPYVCRNNECNKKYTRKTTMERHMRKCKATWM